MPVLSAYSRTPSSAWIIGMDVPSHIGARAGSGASGPGQVLDVHDVRVLAHRFGVRAHHPRTAVQRGPQQPHQRHQQGTVRVLVYGHMEFPVEFGVARVLLSAGGLHLRLEFLEPLDPGFVDLVGGEGRAQRLQGGADLKVLLGAALVRLDHHEPAVVVADDQALRLQPPERLPHRRLADLEALRQVALAQLLTRGELTGNDQLADQRRHHVGLADVSRPGFPGSRADHRNRSHVRPSAFVVSVLAVRGAASAMARTRPGVSGSALTSWLPPSASRTALASVAPAAVMPPSPAPRTPSGLPGAGACSETKRSIRGISAAVGIRYSMNVVAVGWP